MKTIIIYCKKCHLRLTEKLVEIDQKQVYFPENVDAIPEGRFVFFKEGTNLDLLINKNQPLLNDHKDKSRFMGCCGSDGLNGMNKICSNGHEVATEFSDCYTSYYINISLKNTIIKMVKEDGNVEQVDYKFYTIK